MKQWQELTTLVRTLNMNCLKYEADIAAVLMFEDKTKDLSSAAVISKIRVQYTLTEVN